MKMNVFGRMLNLPRAFQLIERSTGSGHAAFFMAFVYGSLALFMGILWYVYDLSSTDFYMVNYLIWIAESGRLPVWITILITSFFRILAVFLPSLLQWALADERIRSHPAFNWAFFACVGFDFITDAPFVVTDTRKFIYPIVEQWLGTYAVVAMYPIYVCLIIIASLTLQTITTCFALGAYVSWQKRIGHGQQRSDIA